jgi:hypothetical protein
MDGFINLTKEEEGEEEEEEEGLETVFVSAEGEEIVVEAEPTTPICRLAYLVKTVGLWNIAN